ACGAGESRSFQPPALAHGKKAYISDGGHRVVPPEETLARHGYHVSPITGAVPLLERAAPDGDGVLHVYVAGSNSARPSRSLGRRRSDRRAMSSGKGPGDLQAGASALCEGLERYSGVYRGDEPRRLARQAELGGAAVPLNDCLLFSERQYRERDSHDAGASRF